MIARRPLLEWYAPRRRRYPWRGSRDPYRVLVSEVMLQQTQAARVAPAYRAFVRRFPTVRMLSSAPRSEVLRAWGGLGYNRRAVALSDAARAIVLEHGGVVPRDQEVLRTLPGIGPYTASAVAALAFGAARPALDVNVRRVAARAVLGTDEVSPRAVDLAAARSLDRANPASWNQALMDLGREICRPTPRCAVCPIAPGCAFRRAGSTPTVTRRRQAPFEGSMRQLRGAVIRELLRSEGTSLGALAECLDEPVDRLEEAVRGLARDREVIASRRALDGLPHGRVRLA